MKYIFAGSMAAFLFFLGCAHADADLSDAAITAYKYQIIDAAI